MVDNIENKVLIREFNEDRDIEVVGKLERKCEIGSKRGVSLFINTMGGDPLCRVRFYPLHVMLVAELHENGEVVGVVRGCIKRVGTNVGEAHLNIGCILGLRVSPEHRRMGVGLKLVSSVEEWVARNGVHYSFLAIEDNNVASKNLFTLKCNYVKFSSLVIFIQPIDGPRKIMSRDVKIEKLNVEQAISLYRYCLRNKELYPADFDVILKEKLSLGTWVSYFREEDWVQMNREENNNADFYDRMPSSWLVFSIWNTCKACKLQITHPLKLFFATLSHVSEKLLPCFKMPISDTFGKSFGFFFLYGIYGEGERVGELIESPWFFASRLAEDEKDCNAIITELSISDPLMQYDLSRVPSISQVKDVWYMKRLRVSTEDEVGIMSTRPVGNSFIDPRDF